METFYYKVKERCDWNNFFEHIKDDFAPISIGIFYRCNSTDQLYEVYLASTSALDSTFGDYEIIRISNPGLAIILEGNDRWNSYGNYHLFD